MLKISEADRERLDLASDEIDMHTKLRPLNLHEVTLATSKPMSVFFMSCADADTQLCSSFFRNLRRCTSDLCTSAVSSGGDRECGQSFPSSSRDVYVQRCYCRNVQGVARYQEEQVW